MILRRITQHVKDQNWFAVALDFVIVVVGILIAFQITEWNEARSERKLKGYYLERLHSDLTDTIDYLSINHKRSEAILEIINQFSGALNNPDTDDSELALKTTDYFARGTVLLNFKVNRITFDDLSSSGNLEILEPKALVTALTRLHTDFADQDQDLLVNTDWILGSEVILVTEFDWFRFDELTTHLFSSKSPADIAVDIRSAEDNLRRNAALHYWFIDALKRDYEIMIAQSQTVLEMLTQELEN